jgi:hypothetical protein
MTGTGTGGPGVGVERSRGRTGVSVFGAPWAFKLWRERRLTGFPAGDGRPRGGVTRGERPALVGRVGKVRS